jgi:PilZ domain
MADPKDRRAQERFAVNADTSCSFVSPVVENFGPVRLKNISMDGIGLQVTKKLDPGTLLVMTISNPAKSFAKTVLVRVAHATPQDAGYLVGGTFQTPLTYQELTTLVL